MGTISDPFRHKGKRAILLAVMVLLLALLSWSVLVSAEADSTEGTANQSAVTALQNNYTVCLPVAMRNYPPPPPTFGIWMGVESGRNLALAADAGAYWINTPAFDWSLIEPTRTEPTPTYLWGTVNEQGLSNATQAGLVPVVRVHLTPPWARELPDHNCSRIRRESLDEFAQFLTALVNRYKAPPYNIRYWELDSEVDVDPSLVDESNPVAFWCWGDDADAYYGGGYFAEMLRYAYPAIKEADPLAQVVIGGLLLDCDPTHPPAGRDCKPSMFLEGILRNGGGNYFDILSFHGHAPYNGSLQQDEHYPSWEYRGGVVLGKVSFVRQVMATYGVSKPLMHTEGSLLCRSSLWCDPPDTTFYEKQADYVVWLFVRNWAEGVLGTTWFQFEGPGVDHSGMLYADQNPKPVYWAFRFLTTELGNAMYSERVTQYPALRGYAFTAPGKRIWVLWSPDQWSHSIVLPSGVTKVYDKYGNDVTPSGSDISVDSPIYVELYP